MEEAIEQTPFQIFADDVKLKYSSEIKELSPLEVSRKIAFLWTKMSQSERRGYYERAGKRVDKSLSAKIRVLPSSSSDVSLEKDDSVRAAPKQPNRGTDPKEANKKPRQDSNDSDEDEYVAPRRGVRRGKGRKTVDQDWEDFVEDNKPRRRGGRRRKVFTE